MLASTINLLAALGGLVTASILIGGFLAHAKPALAGKEEAELRRATVVGGLVGLGLVLLGVLILILLT